MPDRFGWCRRNEGVATHIGLEPCVGTREGDDAALSGERIGQVLSVLQRRNRKEDECPRGSVVKLRESQHTISPELHVSKCYRSILANKSPSTSCQPAGRFTPSKVRAFIEEV